MRRVAVVVAVVALLAAAGLVGGVVLLTPKTAVGRNVFVNPAGIIDAYSTPSVVVDPRRTNDLVVAYREDRPTLTAGLSWSADGGTTFHQTALPLPNGVDRPFFPDVAFAPDGTLFVTYVNLIGNGNVPGNLWVTHSSNDGRTLAPPTLLATGMTFQPRLSIGPNNAVHITWVQSTRNGQATLTGDLVTMLISQSVDGGQHWSTPTQVNPADGRLVSSANAVIDKGSLVLVYERFGPTVTNLITGATTPQPDTYDIVVTRSNPGGTSFSDPVVVASGVRNTQRFSLFFPEFPSLGSAPDGSLYVTWSKGLAQGQDVVVARSGDLGAHWSAPVRANDNPVGDGTARSLPTLSVAPNGRVDVVMIDRRNDKSGQFAEAYLASSTNGGHTFHDVRLSTSTFDTKVGPTFGGNLPPDLGAHLSVASQATAVTVAWSDSRLGNETTGRQDILMARVSMPATGLGGRTWLVVAAGALVVMAVVVLLLGRRSERNETH
jgi:hypothetical protein